MLSSSIAGNPGARIIYEQCFSSDSTLQQLGYSSNYWAIDTNTNAMKSTAPGGWTQMAGAYSPSIVIDRAVSAATVEASIRFPTEYGPSWREYNKFWISICSDSDDMRYRILIKPNRAQDQYTSPDLYVERVDNGQYTTIAQAYTHTLTPHGSSAKSVRLKIILGTATSSGGNGSIQVLYDVGNGSGYKKYIDVLDNTYLTASKIHFQYYTGTGNANYFIEINQIKSGFSNLFSTASFPLKQTTAGNLGPTNEISAWENHKNKNQTILFQSPFPNSSPVQLDIPAGHLVSSYIPIIKCIQTLSPAVPAPQISANEHIKMAYEITGNIAVDSTLCFPFTIPYSPLFPIAKSTFRLIHLREPSGTWEELPIDTIYNSTIYATVHSFSTYAVVASEGNVIFVNQSNSGNADGLSWATAFPSLQVALTAARNSTSIKEIWVAKGTYLPGATGARQSTFTLVKGVSLFGGFTGDELSIEARNPTTNTTILSGNLDNDNKHSVGDAYHVISAINQQAHGVTIDGFTIEHGNADGPSASFQSSGGGLYINGGAGEQQFEIRNCIFQNNKCLDYGGAIYNFQNNPGHNSVIRNCTFQKNGYIDPYPPKGNGGAIYLDAPKGASGTSTIDHCIFEENQVTDKGGAIYCNKFNVTVRASLFEGNGAYNGGAMYLENSSPSIENNLFLCNEAVVEGEIGSGGAVYSASGSPHFLNCNFYSNDARLGATYDWQSQSTYINCIFWQNRMQGESTSQMGIGDASNINIQNCDIEGDVGGIEQSPNATVTTLNIIHDDPLFHNVMNAKGTDNVWGTTDDGFRLALSSKCHSAGDHEKAPVNDILDQPKPLTTASIGAYYIRIPENPNCLVDFLIHPNNQFGFDKISHNLKQDYNPDEIYISLGNAIENTTTVYVVVTGTNSLDFYVSSSDPKAFIVKNAVNNKLSLNNRNVSEVTIISQHPPTLHTHAMLNVYNGDGTLLRGLNVEIYKEQTISLTYNRIIDKSSPLTYNNFYNRSRSSAEAIFNNVLRQAVVNVEFASYNEEADLSFDLNKNGKLDNYIYPSNSSLQYDDNPEMKIWKNSTIPKGDGTFITFGCFSTCSIILEADASAGTTSIIVAKDSYFPSYAQYLMIGPDIKGGNGEVIFPTSTEPNFDGAGRIRINFQTPLECNYKKTIQPDIATDNFALTGASIGQVFAGGMSAGSAGAPSVMIYASNADGGGDARLWPHEVFHTFQTPHSFDPDPDVQNLMTPVQCGTSLRCRPIYNDDNEPKLIQQWNLVNRQ